MANQFDVSRFESSRRVMDRILRDLGLNNTQEVENEELWIGWIFEAQTQIRIPVSLEQPATEAIDIVDCIAPKPKGMVILVSASVLDGDCCHIPWYRNPSRFLVSPGCPNLDSGCSNGMYEMVSHPFFFQLSSNANGKKLLIDYKRYGFDEAGYPVVDTHYYLPILFYARWKWIGRSRASGLREFSGSDEQEAQRNWHLYKARSMSQDMINGLNPDMMDQIMAEFNHPFYRSTNRYYGNNKANDLAKSFRGLTGVAIREDANI